MKKVILAGVILIMLYILGFGGAAYYYTYKGKVNVSAKSPDNKGNDKERIYVEDTKNTNNTNGDEQNKGNGNQNGEGEKLKPGEQSNNGNNSTTPKGEANFNPVVADVATLNKEEKSWYYNPQKDGVPSGEPQQIKDLIGKYRGYYLGNTDNKVIYLTFDEGYENGYTGKILDILKENDVKAAFFVTTSYINGNEELIKRMVTEGHMVCNHSTTHPSMATIKDEQSFNKELVECEKAFEKVTTAKMHKYFRPPMGRYSELSLYYTQKLQYRTIFWSFAYGDWEPTNQPTAEYAKNLIMERTHGGGIYLLHAVSKTNMEILDWIIKEWKSKGYEFKALYEIE